ncbi:MAG: HAD family hydrolase [Spirochaetales bacterium]|nr:HAD family hydrolase [Spirochaetales bacterium]
MIKYIRDKTKYLHPCKAEFIFFDKGGTLSKPVLKRPDKGFPEYKKIMDILGAEGDPLKFGKIISLRDKNYKKWGMETWTELSEEERCTRFLFPDFPEDVVIANAQELTLLFSHSKGVRELRAEALGVVKSLHKKGYPLGVISNTVSTVLVPGELAEAGLTPYVQTLVMSSINGIRKPDPEMFLEAATTAGVEPSLCVYIGDQPNRDVEGPRRAGYGLNIILKTSNYPDSQELSDLQTPDIIIDHLEELNELFPSKGGE